jgi:hypothetical protein
LVTPVETLEALDPLLSRFVFGKLPRAEDALGIIIVRFFWGLRWFPSLCLHRSASL